MCLTPEYKSHLFQISPPPGPLPQFTSHGEKFICDWWAAQCKQGAESNEKWSEAGHMGTPGSRLAKVIFWILITEIKVSDNLRNSEDGKLINKDKYLEILTALIYFQIVSHHFEQMLDFMFWWDTQQFYSFLVWVMHCVEAKY